MTDDEPEVFELTGEEWDAIVEGRLRALGLTRAQLIRKHWEGHLTAEEFKLWMLL